jgi:hypothetical protein
MKDKKQVGLMNPKLITAGEITDFSYLSSTLSGMGCAFINSLFFQGLNDRSHNSRLAKN